MSTNRNVEGSREVPVISIHMTGNAQLSLVAPVASADRGSTSHASVNPAEQRDGKRQLWKTVLFWTAVSALAGAASAAAAIF